MIRRLVRRIVLWAVPEATPKPPVGSVIYVCGDPFDTETNPRRRAEIARKIVEGN